jgi:8-oxo-dGTP pyrophosphatase MutT (NUDIX family)
MPERHPDLKQTLIEALSAPGRASSDYDLNQNVTLPADRFLKPAAVLIAVREETQTLLLTKRSTALKHHPGQVAFPGGKIDPGDTGPVDAALREAREEIGLPDHQVEVLGTLPPHETVTSYAMTPVLGILRGDFTPVIELAEVSEAFEVPFCHITDPSRFHIESRHWRGTERRYYTVTYGPYYIWGATARILAALSDRIAR